ncbi:MAG TPA: hypothetical protein VHP61_06535, partial [Acidobacteriota bacterium]|nr:hypothetical protein [Acidobacteriota bacterium]
MTFNKRKNGIARKLSRRGRKVLVLVLPALVVAMGLAVLYLVEQGGRDEARKAPPPPPAPAEAAIGKPPASPLHRETVSRGTTLAEILPKYGFLPKDIHELREQVKPVYDLGRIRAGRELRIRTTPEGEWASLEYDIDENRFLVVRNEAGRFRAEIKPVPYEVRTAFLWAAIEDSPIAAVN